jgi:hypothetical protein
MLVGLGVVKIITVLSVLSVTLGQNILAYDCASQIGLNRQVAKVNHAKTR